jgi:Leucine-rich repeat (LRR) protein
MNRWAKCVLLGIVFSVAMVLPAQLVSLAQEPAKEPIRPAPEVIAAWEEAGAEFGWISILQLENLPWRSGKEKPPAGAVPAFRVTLLPPGKIKVLPPPGVPFGLRFEGLRVTDAGLKELAGLQQLQRLELIYTQVTDAGMKELAGLKQLRTLNLFGTPVTDAGLKELSGLKQLQTLLLYGASVTDAGLKELSGLKQLQTLDLQAPQVTDAGLKKLAGLTKLQSLGLVGTKVTNTGVQELQRALPLVQISH